MNEDITAKIAAGTASATDTITNAYVLDATKAEETLSYTIIGILLRIAAFIFLVVLAVVVYFIIAGKNISEEFGKIKASVIG